MNKKSDSIIKYLFLFLLFSFLGRIYELDLVISFGTLNYLSHFPTAIYTLIFAMPYGVAGLLLYGIIKILNKNKFTSNIIFRIIVCVVVVNLIELSIGLLTLKFLGVMPWDYSLHWLNYKGLISLPITVRWTMFSILFNLFAYSKIKSFIEKLLSNKIKKITIVTLVVYGIYLAIIISLKVFGVF